MINLLKKTQNLFLYQQKTIFSSALIISGMIIISRFFGFIRLRILASYFTKDELDIFFAAFRIPDLIFEFLITGALSTAFVPLVIKYQKDKKKLNTYLNSIINLILLTMTLIIILLIVFSKTLYQYLTPGFSYEKINQIVFFSRMLLLGQLPFMVLGNLLIGFAQAHHIFLITAIAPVLYNLVTIVTVVVLHESFYLKSAVFGVIFGAIIFFLSQLPILKRIDFQYKFILQINQGINDFFKLALPRIFSVMLTQIDASVDLFLTSFLGGGSYTIFYFAQHLQLLPVSLIGLAFSQASLPYLSQLFQEKKENELKKIMYHSTINILFITIPIAFFFIFARTPLVRLFFGGEKFDWSATVMTAYTLSLFSISLPFHSLYYLYSRYFFATLDSRTPLVTSLIGSTVNTILSLIFVFWLNKPVYFLALAFSLAITINVFILFFRIFHSLSLEDKKNFLIEIIKIILASSVAAVSTYQIQKILSLLIFDLTRTINVFFLLVTAIICFFLLYLIFAWFLELKSLSLFSQIVAKTRLYQKRIIELYNQYD